MFKVAALHEETDMGKKALEMATRTLRAMANGGIRDHLGQGFHRYSVDKYWKLPQYGFWGQEREPAREQRMSRGQQAHCIHGDYMRRDRFASYS